MDQVEQKAAEAVPNDSTLPDLLQEKACAKNVESRTGKGNDNDVNDNVRMTDTNGPNADQTQEHFHASTP